MKLIFGCCCMFLFIFRNDAQTPIQHQFIKKYDERNGLFSPDCTQLFDDDEGNIWISSFESISRFDGRNFVNYSKQSGLDCSAVYNLKRDKTGYIYVLTDNGVFSYTGNVVQPFKKVVTTPDSIREDIIAIDKSSFWLAGDNIPGLFLIKNGKIHRYFSSDHFVQLAKSKEGYVYAVSSEERIYVLKDTVLAGIVKPPLTPNININLTADYEGRIWYGNGLGLYQFSKLTLQKITDWPPTKVFNSRFHIGQRTGDIYLLDSVIYRYHCGKWSPWFNQRATIFDGFEDRNGTLWIGTNDKGLYKVEANPVINLDNVQALPFIQKKEQLILQVNDLKNLPRSQYKTHQYSFNQFSGMDWNCTENGLYYRNNSNESYKRYVASDTSTINSNDKLFLKAVSDHNGTVWFSSYNGIDCYSKGNFQHFNSQQGLFAKAVYDIATDKYGNVYAGASGLYTYEKGKFFVILRERLGNGIIWSLCTDPAGRLWAMNLSGKLYCIEKNRKGFFISDSIINTINNLPVISRGIGFDQYSNFWFASRQFIFIYPIGKNGKYDHHSRLVLPAYFEDPVKMVCGSDGYMYLYNKLGSLAKINTDSALHTASTAPAVSDVHLTTIRFAERNEQATNPVLYPAQTKLNNTTANWPYERNDPTFYFSAISIAYPEYVMYRYKLQGLDSTWQPVTTTGTAVYYNLKPGSYTLIVEASDIRCNWTKASSYTFVILSPWYRSLWAYILFSVLLTAAAIGLFALGAKQARRRAEIKHLIVEQQLKAIRAQINPHFLHNIFAFLALRIHHNSSAVLESLEVLSHYIREVLYATDKSIVTLEEEITFTDKYIEIQKLVLPVKFEYQFHLDDAVDTIGLMVPSMLFQPILENAFKYGLSKDSINNQISISIIQKEDYTCCSISDSGNKELAATKPDNYIPKGLSLTIERLKLLYRNVHDQPTVSKDSNSYGGTTITILLPNRQKKP